MVVVGEGVKEDFGLWILDFGFGTGMSAEYDPNGNFIALTRQGPSGTGDSFLYNYYNDIPNQLRHVAGTSTLSDIA